MMTHPITLKHIAVILIFAIVPGYSLAWEKTYTIDYRMGDNDTRNEALNWATEQVKIKASQEAGTYIQGTTTLSNNEIHESITQISASVISVTVTGHEIINQDGWQILRVNASASVDESIMTQRINALKEDAQKARDIQILAHENQKLRQELDKLAASRASSSDLSTVNSIRMEEQRVIAAMNSNIAITRQSFAPIVNQLDQAIKDAVAKREQEQRDKANAANQAISELENYRANSAKRKSGLTFDSTVNDLTLDKDGKYFTGNISVKITTPEIPHSLSNKIPPLMDEKEMRRDHYYGILVETGGIDIAYIPIPLYKELPECKVYFALGADFLRQQSGFKLKLISHDDYYDRYPAILLNDLKTRVSEISKKVLMLDPESTFGSDQKKFSVYRTYINHLSKDIFFMSGLLITNINFTAAGPMFERRYIVPDPEQIRSIDHSIKIFYSGTTHLPDPVEFNGGRAMGEIYWNDLRPILSNKCYVQFLSLPQMTDEIINSTRLEYPGYDYNKWIRRTMNK